ncbi:hypothetical protein [Candidatus Enterovibrio escicola]|uniref:hypothetical protein n=1 Tax=Candidatus Enterovibrio escicola TaxID=1927127 RepID=UPI001237D410|nr:hypothetical protein [Candidatus Enterovibrio escacola]
MSDWCIVSNEALSNPAQNDTIQQLVDLTCDVGVCHDGINTLFTSAPSYQDEHVVIIEESEDDLDLIKQLGSFMKSNSADKILIAESSVFIRLFAHPMFKLWCGNYEDKSALISDYKSAFNVELGENETLENLKSIARSTVYGAV